MAQFAKLLLNQALWTSAFALAPRNIQMALSLPSSAFSRMPSAHRLPFGSSADTPVNKASLGLGINKSNTLSEEERLQSIKPDGSQARRIPCQCQCGGYCWLQHQVSSAKAVQTPLEAVPSPKSRKGLCQDTFKSRGRTGEPCTYPAAFGGFCGYHKPKAPRLVGSCQCQAIAPTTGNPCKNRMKSGDYCWIHKPVEVNLRLRQSGTDTGDGPSGTAGQNEPQYFVRYTNGKVEVVDSTLG